MKQKLLLSLLIGLSMTLASYAQVTVSGAHASSNGTYTKLSLAFTAINNHSQSGNIIVITITSSPPAETGSATLNSGSWTSVKIYPTTTGLSISGSLSSSALIDLNGADNVTIDGRVNETGSTVSLVISNASTSNGTNTATIRFTNDATNNCVKYCKLQGSTTADFAGIIFFNYLASTSGNSNNTIDHNEITNTGGNRPRNALFSCGNSAEIPNSSNSVTNNNFYDVLNLDQNWTRVIVLSDRDDAHPNNSYNTAWTISGNSFYDTQDFSTSNTSGQASVIYVWASQGGGFTISNNYIGGNAPLCSGTWTKTTGNIAFIAIFLNVSEYGTANYIQGNTIKNFIYTNSSNWGWTTVCWNSGANYVSNNCIGESTGTGSIVFTAGATGASFIGFQQGVYCASSCNNNTIGSITLANSNPAYATNFLGIWVASSCGSGSTNNNLIGSTVTPNSIHATSAASSYAQTVVGIKIQGSSGDSPSISNNTIANLTNGTTNSTASTQGYIYGIYPILSINNITGNTIHDLTIANANDGTGPVINGGDPNTSLSAGGIVAPIYNDHDQTISGNTIYNISNSYSSFTGHVVGIYHYGQSSASSVNGNLIYGLSVSAGSSSASIHGIKVGQGTTTYSNNIIVLGGNTTSNLYGIYDANTSWWNTSNIYFNTVYLSGSPASGSLNSACLYHDASGGGVKNYKNNILFNARSNNSATGKHYAIYLTGTASAIDNNDYYITGNGGMLGYFGSNISTLADWRTATGQDSQSLDLNPSLASAGGTNATNYIPSTLLPAALETGVITDYGGSVRSDISPEMGAWEKNTALIWTGNTSTDWSVAGNWDLVSTPLASSVVSIPSGTANQPHITQAVESPATCNNITIQSGAVLTIDPGMALTVNGTLTNSAGNSGLVIKSDATGTGSLIQSSSSVGATVERYITGSATLTDYKYHMVSIPVYYGSPTSNLFLGSYLYYLDPAQQDPTNSNYYGKWVLVGSSTSYPLACNTGYMIYCPQASTTYTFTGNLNTGSFPLSVSYGGTYTFNLVPNPYPSAINWGSSGGWVKNNIGSTAYVWPYGAGNYTTITASSNYNIPAGQSFVVMTSGSPTLTVNNSACVHSSQAFYKSAPSNELRITAQSNNYSDEVYVSLNPSAVNEFDPQFDGLKLWGLDEAPQLWTEKGEFRLSVHQQPITATGLTVPIDFRTSFTGQVTLSFSGIESFDPLLPIRLRDNILGTWTNLRDNPTYTFTHDTLNTDKRFSLVFGYQTGIRSDIAACGKAFIANGKICFDIPEMQGHLATLTLYDMLGKVIRTEQKEVNGTMYLEADLAKGVYIAKATAADHNLTVKIMNM